MSGSPDNARLPIPVRPMVAAVLLAIASSPVQAQALPFSTSTPAAPLKLTLPADPVLQPLFTRQPTPPDVFQSASDEAKKVARWVADSGDNARLPYLLIDKVNATVYAFSAGGRLQGSAPVLLGMARGDHMLVENSATMEAMPPSVRITPAGRFVSRLATDSLGKELLVLDYDASLSLHAVVTNKPEEHRLLRLATPSVQDNRISFGCINVPASFYAKVVSPSFTGTKGVVYVLPETGPANEVFAMSPAVEAAPATANTVQAPAEVGSPRAAEPAAVPAADTTSAAH